VRQSGLLLSGFGNRHHGAGARVASLQRSSFLVAVAPALILLGSGSQAQAQCSTAGVATVTVTCGTNTTTTSTTNSASPNAATSDRLQDFNSNIVGQIAPGVTVGGVGLSLRSEAPGSTISVTNAGTVTSNQAGLGALELNAGVAGDFGQFTYSGAGTVSNTAAGAGIGLILHNSGAGNDSVTINTGGTVSSSNGTAISADSGTGALVVTVQQGATVTGATALSMAAGGANTLHNAGTMTGTGALGVGVAAVTATIDNSGSITGGFEALGVNTLTLSSNTGTISGATIGIATTSANITNNSGGIIQATGAGGAGINATGALTITNNLGGIIQSTGAGGAAINVNTGAATAVTVNNFATIAGTLDGVNTLTTVATSITNSGTITGTTRQGIRVNTAEISNTGTVTGTTGIFFRSGNGASTIFNSGTITGTGGTAIQFSVGSVGNTLTLGGGSNITGTVLGQGADILQLGGTSAATFNVGNIGAGQQYQGFSTFNKVDTSTWTLTGTGTANQNWTISQGMLIGDTTSLQGATITDNAALTFNQAATGTYAGTITGGGALTIAGGGTVIFTGANNYTGTTTITSSTLQIGNGGTTGSLGTGSVTDNGTLVFNRSDALAFGGIISGSGALTQSGAGTLTLSGTDTYTGPTNVNAGTLNVTGSLLSTVNVNAGGTLIGTGPIGGLNVGSGGTVAPSAAGTIGTLNVNGNVAFAAGSNYQIKTNAAGQSDKIAATGTATLNGGSVLALSQAGVYAPQTIYTILTAAGGRTGTFAGVTDSLTFLTPSLTYTANSVLLSLTQTANFASVARTSNQLAVANALDKSPPTGALLIALFNSNAASARQGFDALSGEGLSGAQEGALGAGGMFLDSMMEQAEYWLDGASSRNASAGNSAMGYAPEKPMAPVFKAMPLKAPTFEPRWRSWAAGFDGAWSLNGEPGPGSADLTHRSAGGAAGVDHQITPDLLVGAAVGGSTSSFSVSERSTSGSLDGAHVGAYGVARRGGWYTAGSIAFAAFNNKTSRTIAGIGPTETATASFNSNLIGGRLEMGFKQGYGAFSVTPFAAVEFAQLRQAGFTESSTTVAGGAGVAGLTVGSRTVSSLPTFLGVQLDNRVALGNGMTWTPSARIAWVHEFDPNREITASFITVPGASFTVDGPPAARDAARIDAGSKLAIGRNVSLFDSFDGEFSGRSRMYAGKGGVLIEW
jgi:outer membrane autotransporter protein